MNRKLVILLVSLLFGLCAQLTLAPKIARATSTDTDPKHVKAPGSAPETPAANASGNDTAIGVRATATPSPNGSNDDERTKLRVQSRDPFTPSPCENAHVIDKLTTLSRDYAVQAGPQGGVFFLSDRSGTPQVYFQTTAHGPALRLTILPAKAQTAVKGFQVSPRGDYLLLLTQNDKNEESLFLTTPKASPATALVSAKTISSFFWSANQTNFFFTEASQAKETALLRYDLKTQKKTLLTRLRGFQRITDISPNGNLIALENRRSATDSDLYTWNLSTAQLTKMDHPEAEVGYRAGKFTADSKNLLFLSDQERGIWRLYRLALSKPDSPVPFTTGAWGVDQYQLDASRTQAVLTINEEGYSHWEGYELDAQGEKKKLLLLPSERTAVVTSLSLSDSEKGTTLFYSRGSSTQTEQIRAWRELKETTWTEASRDSVDPQCLIEPILVHYPSFDKRQISGFLFKPKNSPRLPSAVIMAVEEISKQFRPLFCLQAQYLSARGYEVLIPNVRGSSGYGTLFSHLDDRELRLNAVRDLAEGSYWLQEQELANPNEIMAFGTHYGGFTVLRALQIAPQAFKAAAVADPILNFSDYLSSLGGQQRSEMEIELGAVTDEPLLKELSAVTHLSDIKTPLIAFTSNAPANAKQIWWQVLEDKPIIFEGRQIASDKTESEIRFEQIRNSTYFFEQQKKKKGS